MKRLPRFDRREAAREGADAQSWQCASCDRMIEDDSTAPFCRDCASYWEDVRNGIFDE